MLKNQKKESQIKEPCCGAGLRRYLSAVFSKQTLVPMFIIISLFIVQNWSGFIVTIMYTVLIFKEARIELDEFQATIVLGCVQVRGVNKFSRNTISYLLSIIKSTYFSESEYCVPQNLVDTFVAGVGHQPRHPPPERGGQAAPADGLHRPLLALHGHARHHLLPQGARAPVRQAAHSIKVSTKRNLAVV